MRPNRMKLFAAALAACILVLFSKDVVYGAVVL
jgi:hypothetical protein